MNGDVGVGLKEGGRAKSTKAVEAGEDFVEDNWEAGPSMRAWFRSRARRTTEDGGKASNNADECILEQGIAGLG
jgi:hypothetical protein